MPNGLDLRVNKLDSLPVHAWLAEWDGQGVHLFCGRGVETCGNAWFKGVWAGEFEDWGFDTCADVFGTGGRINGDAVHLVPPSHHMERLFAMRLAGTTYAANSLAFLLTHTGSQVLPDRFDYAERFLASLDGMAGQCREITVDKGTVAFWGYFNATIGHDGTITHRPKPQPPQPDDYAGYLTHLRRCLKRCVDNGLAPARRYGFEMATTVSAGYDSPACATLAKEVGCQEAVTFVTSLALDASGQIDDDGRAIGELLGLQVKAFQRTLPESTDSATFTQFYCDGGFGAESSWQVLAGDLRGKLLITGMSANWLKKPTPPTVFDNACCAGLGMTELRHAAGFAHLPVPFIASTWLPALRRISYGDEMKSWSIGGAYDRPIPRRIAEEAGVPRHLFGQVKSGNSFRAWYLDHWPAWMRAMYDRRWAATRMTWKTRLRYGAALTRYQLLRFTCEWRFQRWLANRLSPLGDGSRTVLPVLRGLAFALRTVLRPFNPPHYKTIIRMHPRYTFLLHWANEDAACKYVLRREDNAASPLSAASPIEAAHQARS